MKTVFSAIQPSGELHLGNYLGAISNWVKLQEEYRCIFSLVDYHSITQDYTKKELRSRTLEMAADILALGVDPEKSIFFVQSHVPEHTELCWIFNTIASFGDVSRMTQFKDKSQRQADNINVGLFDYPVLQAADILMYKAEVIPVGQDQVQHVELTRRIARAFNNRWGQTFQEPEAKLSQVPKLLGLDGKAKMSKSLKNTIVLRETDAKIKKSLRKAATDPARIERTDPGDPAKCNVFTFHKFFSNDETKKWVRHGCTSAGIGCVDCKDKLSENIGLHLADFRERREQLSTEDVEQILQAGGKRARKIAQQTMEKVRRKLGLYPIQ